MELRILSVNMGLPAVLGEYRGEIVVSGFAKTPVADAQVFVGAANIEGDGQADLSVHGGIDKAVYCYPADHWPWWEREKRMACRPATFGENLTVMGADESVIAIGDRFLWGEALLEVSQPRAPCFKFAMHTRRDDAPALMTISGRSGWYFRIAREGRAPAQGGALIRERRSGGPSVRDAFFAALDPRVADEIRERVRSAPELAQDWRHLIERKRNRGMA